MSTIRAACDHCGKTYKLPAEARGRRAKCKACGEGFRVPASDEEEAALTYDDLFGPDPQSAACPSCHGALQPEAKFCVGCGYDLVRGRHAGAAVAQAPPSARDSAWVSEDTFIANLQQRKVSHHLMLGFVFLVAMGMFYFAYTLEPALKGETDWLKIIVAGAGALLLLLVGLALTVMYMPSNSSSWNVRAAKLIVGGIATAVGLALGFITLYAAMKQTDTPDGRPIYLLAVGSFAALFFLAVGIKTVMAGLAGQAS